MIKKKLSHRIFPFLDWGQSINRKSLTSDFLAGLTGAIIVLPQGVAFAMIAGLPPVFGLYTAMITPIVAALFGSSRHLISGPTTALSIMIFASVSQFAEAETAEFICLALGITFIAGLIQFVLGVSRMGTLINFVSHSVVIGFTAGAALIIITSQFKHMIGITFGSQDSIFNVWYITAQNLGSANLYILVVSLTTLFVAIILKRLLPLWPNLFIAMIFGSILSALLGAEDHGVVLLGELPAHLPPFAIPDFSMSTVTKMAPNAFAIALLGLIEAVAIARSIASRSGQRIDGNQEFIGQGLSNMVGSFFSCYAGSGSFTRSGLNYQAGAKTQMAAIFAALILMVSLFLIAPLAAYLPLPAMGGIIVLVAFNLIDFHHIKQILKASKRESTVLIITFLSALLLDLEYAIYLGVFFSLVFYLQRTSRPSIVAMAPDPKHRRRKFVNVKRERVDECPQLKILRIDGSVFFGAVDHVQQRLQEERLVYKHILIVCSGVNLLDIAGAELFSNEAINLRKKGGALYLSSLKKNVRDVLERGGYDREIGIENIFAYKEQAIESIFNKLNKSVCENCEFRIFSECNNV